MKKEQKMLMLTLDDAVTVCMRFLHETTYFDDMPREEYESMLEFIRSEFEQKCWIPSDSESAKRLYDLIFDINPAEICAQIESGNLKKWCEIIQVEMNLAMVRLPPAQSEIIYCKNCINAEERGCALFCGFWTRYTAHKGYCFKAERREG